LPVRWIGDVGSVVLFEVANLGHAINPGTWLLGAPWAMFICSLGMSLVGYVLRNAGLTEYRSGVLNVLADTGLWGATLGTGFLTALLSSIMNNLPTLLVGAPSIGGSTATGGIIRAIVHAHRVGVDAGPKSKPVGSLATPLQA
uniref:ArsB/NhaD family transporter n=1 Tax=Salmonella enterica TaxID=28901 RepID=UPI00398C70E1